MVINMQEYIGKTVMIAFDRKHEKDFIYTGTVISINEEFLILDDHKEGEMTLQINRIVSIKEKNENERTYNSRYNPRIPE